MRLLLLSGALLGGFAGSASSQSVFGTPPTYFDGAAASPSQFSRDVRGLQTSDAPRSETAYAKALLDITGDALLPSQTERFAMRAPPPVAPKAVVATPEPASLALVATGLIGLGGLVRKRRPA